MSAIYDALVRLNDRLIVLEEAVDTPVKKLLTLQQQLAEKKRSAKSAQPDLFSIAPAANRNVGFDSAIIARKLDMAIEKVEQVLREG